MPDQNKLLGGRLDQSNVKRRQLPPNLHWFWDQNGAEEEIKQLPANSKRIFLAWDNSASKRKGSKVFSWAESAEEARGAILSVPPKNRFCYEWIQSNHPCKPYLDIDKTSKFEENGLDPNAPFQDPKNPALCFDEFSLQQNEKMRKQLNLFEEMIEEQLHIKPEIVVLSSTRMITSEKKFKVSYHVIINNIVFSNCHNKQIWALMNFGSIFEGADASVYSHEQKFRTLLSCKCSDETRTPLEIAENLCSATGLTFRDTLLTCFERDSVTFIDESFHGYPNLAIEWRKLQPEKTSIKSTCSKNHPSVSPGDLGEHSDLIKPLEDVLMRIGDNSMVSKLVKKSNGELQFQCINKGARRCFLDESGSEIHERNNCLLFVRLVEDEGNRIAVVSAVCTAHNHKKKIEGKKREIALLCSNETEDWRIEQIHVKEISSHDNRAVEVDGSSSLKRKPAHALRGKQLSKQGGSTGRESHDKVSRRREATGGSKKENNGKGLEDSMLEGDEEEENEPDDAMSGGDEAGVNESEDSMSGGDEAAGENELDDSKSEVEKGPEDEGKDCADDMSRVDEAVGENELDDLRSDVEKGPEDEGKDCTNAMLRVDEAVGENELDVLRSDMEKGPEDEGKDCDDALSGGDEAVGENELDDSKSDVEKDPEDKGKDCDDALSRGDEAVGEKESDNSASGNTDLIKRKEEKKEMVSLCCRELSLMQVFSIDDPRTAAVFTAVRSLDISQSKQKNELLQWASRDPNYNAAKTEIFFYQMVPSCHGDCAEAFRALHDLRIKNPGFTMSEEISVDKWEYDSTESRSNTKNASGNKRKRGATGETKEPLADRRSIRPKNLFDGDEDLPLCRNPEDMTGNYLETESEELGGEKGQCCVGHDEEDKKLFVLLDNIDVKISKAGPLIFFARQLFKNKRKEVIDFVQSKMGMKESDAAKIWGMDIKSNWFGYYEQYLKVVLSPQKLISRTLPALFRCPVRDFEVVDQGGCKKLNFYPDSCPPSKHTLSLNTGRIDNDDTRNLAVIKLENLIVDNELAQLLVSNGVNRSVGFYGSEYYLLCPNGAWKRSSSEKVQLIIGKTLKPILTKQLDLLCFKESLGGLIRSRGNCTGSLSSKMLEVLIGKYCSSCKGGAELLKALKPMIEFVPGNYPELICFENGLVDLKTKNFLGPAPYNYYITRSIPHRYNDAADQSMINEYMQSMFSEAAYRDSSKLQEFVQTFLGSCLTEEKSSPMSVFHVGQGSNGKSEFCDILIGALGKEICRPLSAESLCKDGGQNNDNLFRAEGARSAIITESVHEKKMNDKMFKSVTGGDIVDVQKKHVESKDVRYTMKLNIFANSRPKFVHDGERALQRRWVVLPWRTEFLGDGDHIRRERLINEGHERWISPKNPELMKKIINEGNEGLLAYLVDGAHKMYQCPGYEIPIPPSILEATEQEREDKCDGVGDFVKASFETGGSCDFISTEEIEAVYIAVNNFDRSIFHSDDFFKKLKNQLVVIHPEAQKSKKKNVKTPGGSVQRCGYSGLVWKKNLSDVAKRILAGYGH